MGILYLFATFVLRALSNPLNAQTAFKWNNYLSISISEAGSEVVRSIAQNVGMGYTLVIRHNLITHVTSTLLNHRDITFASKYIEEVCI